MLEINDYFHEHFRGLGNIFPDPLKLTAVQDYHVDIVVSDDAFQYKWEWERE